MQVELSYVITGYLTLSLVHVVDREVMTINGGFYMICICHRSMSNAAENGGVY